MIDPITVMYDEGRRQALALQARSAGMTGTELNAEDDKIPAFQTAKKRMNMLDILNLQIQIARLWSRMALCPVSDIFGF